MVQKIDHLKESPSQTAGPYVHIGCVPNFCGLSGVYPADPGAVMTNDATKGERISVTGCVYDGVGAELRDVLIEIWQADADGIYPGNDPRGPADPNFTGWGRQAGDYGTGEWTFQTIRPGPVPFPDGRLQAPHITFWVVARGINTGLHTRMYFPDVDTAADPVLSRIEHKARIPTLIASETGPNAFRFDVHLQGDQETVFFDM
ncbi:MAG: protocatechuate 3,4-dioxygenase subunit alpha [Pseudomonadota bacterium]